MRPHLSVLFVDRDGHESVVAALRSSCEVTTASSEEQAVRALRTFRPTIVITELDLPDGDGLTVCRQSKELFAEPPLVLVTTMAAERVPDAFLAGCDAALMKPFMPNSCTRGSACFCGTRRPQPSRGATSAARPAGKVMWSASTPPTCAACGTPA